MLIESLRAKNFRNFESLELKPGPHLNILLGENAQGKTSVLESIYFLSQLKSFRTKNLSEIIQFNKMEMQVESIFSANAPKFHDKNEVKIRFGAEQKKITFNQKEVGRDKYHGKMKAVVFSPESLSVIKGGPEGRRQVIDDATTLVFEEASRVHRRYEKIVKQRNAWLRQIRNEEVGLQAGRDLVESLQDQFLLAGTDLLFLRTKLMKEIRPPLQQILDEILGEKVKIEIQNSSREKPWDETEWSEINRRLSTEVLDAPKRRVEEHLGRSMSGPHLHDISFVFSGHDARNFCSQGQQRAVILAFKIAEMVYHKQALGNYPILLLDDVLSEFDKNKQKYLVNFLNKNEAQTFLTATEHRNLVGAEIFNVESGKIKKA